MAQTDLDRDTPAAWRLFFAEMLRVVQAVHGAHLARSESEQARRLANEARKALDKREGAPRVDRSAPGRAPRGGQVCPGKGGTEGGRGCEAPARWQRRLRPEQFARTTTGRAPSERFSEVGR